MGWLRFVRTRLRRRLPWRTASLAPGCRLQPVRGRASAWTHTASGGGGAHCALDHTQAAIAALLEAVASGKCRSSDQRWLCWLARASAFSSPTACLAALKHLRHEQATRTMIRQAHAGTPRPSWRRWTMRGAASSRTTMHSCSLTCTCRPASARPAWTMRTSGASCACSRRGPPAAARPATAVGLHKGLLLLGPQLQLRRACLRQRVCMRHQGTNSKLQNDALSLPPDASA